MTWSLSLAFQRLIAFSFARLKMSTQNISLPDSTFDFEILMFSSGRVVYASDLSFIQWCPTSFVILLGPLGNRVLGIILARRFCLLRSRLANHSDLRCSIEFCYCFVEKEWRSLRSTLRHETHSLCTLFRLREVLKSVVDDTRAGIAVFSQYWYWSPVCRILQITSFRE